MIPIYASVFGLSLGVALVFGLKWFERFRS